MDGFEALVRIVVFITVFICWIAWVIPPDDKKPWRK